MVTNTKVSLQIKQTWYYNLTIFCKNNIDQSQHSSIIIFNLRRSSIPKHTERHAFPLAFESVRISLHFSDSTVRTHVACLCVCFAELLSFPAEQINLCPSSYAFLFDRGCSEDRNDEANPKFNRLCSVLEGTRCTVQPIKLPNSLQTLPQSPSIKTLCLAYKNKTRHRAEYQISPLEHRGTCYLATKGI